MNPDFAAGPSVIHHADPRLRVISAVILSVLMAVCTRLEALSVGLVGSAVLAVLAQLRPMGLLKRLTVVNGFLLLLWIVLPLATPGDTVANIGPLTVSRAGLVWALAITLKSNAILLTCMALIATMDPVSLGHALHHLRLPSKLIHLLLFSVRYVELLQREYHRLRDAMRVRCFRPRMSRHTYRAFGYLVGMLLVNSLERSERVLAAMKCRGFKGEFYVFHHFALSRTDAILACAVAILSLGVGVIQWTTIIL